MLVNDLLKGVEVLKPKPDLMSMEISDILADSRELPDANDPEGKIMFFAYSGTVFDSHSVAEQLYREGRIALIIAEKAVDAPHILVKNGRKAFAAASANIFGNPNKNLTMIGVTGTNGKTTTTWIIEKILNNAGIKTVRIGTTGALVGGRHYELDNTTPSAYEFYKLLAEGVSVGAGAAVAEISSHALEQDRLGDTFFDIAVFTNLTGDHMDYHKDVESYYQVKKRLFSTEKSRRQIINTVHESGRRLYGEAGGERFSFGMDNGDLSVVSFIAGADTSRAAIRYKGQDYELIFKLAGQFNFENVLAAVSVSLCLSVPMDVIIEAVAQLGNVPGRLEKYTDKGITVFVDYAHTDDALENVLSTLSDICSGRLITVFGAGGDRDRTKRPRMGKVARKYSNLVVVTSDNPRSEEPMAIINDILAGMTVDGSVYVEADREKAIAYSIEVAREGDTILVAGKGHENYQIIGSDRIHFSDAEMVQKYLHKRRNGES